MTTLRLALAALRYPDSPQVAVASAVEAVHEAARHGAQLVVFPECYIPGYRWPTRHVPPADAGYLEAAWNAVAAAAAAARITVVLGTERFTPAGLVLTALVIDQEGRRVGWQDQGRDRHHCVGLERGAEQVGAPFSLLRPCLAPVCLLCGPLPPPSPLPAPPP